MPNLPRRIKTKNETTILVFASNQGDQEIVKMKSFSRWNVSEYDEFH